MHFRGRLAARGKSYPIPAIRSSGNGAKPVFFGHYWLTGNLSLQSGRCACVDYSAGKGGPLVAYGFDGESNLALDKFVLVN